MKFGCYGRQSDGACTDASLAMQERLEHYQCSRQNL
jgi:hypothetical protein